MGGNITWNVMSVAFRFALLVLTLIVHALIAFGAYAASVVGFQLIGLDQAPLGEDELVGPIFTALGLGDATLCHVAAAGMVLIIFVGATFVSHFVLQLWRYASDRRMYRALGRDREAALATQAMMRLALPLILAVVFLALIIWFDSWLFRMRLLAAAEELQAPGSASGLPGWMQVGDETEKTFVHSLASLGLWSYAAMSLLAGLVLARVFESTRDAVYAVINDQPAAQPAEQADTAGDQPQPVPPAREPVIRPDRLGAMSTPANGNGGAHGGQWEAPPAVMVGEPTAPAEEPVYAGPAPGAEPEPRLAVIGGDPGETVTRTEAAGQPDRYVLDEQGRPWRREFRERLARDSPQEAGSNA